MEPKLQSIKTVSLLRMKYHTPALCTQNISLKILKRATFQANPINKTDTVNFNLLLLKNREAI
jgi:hypothetical protein